MTTSKRRNPKSAERGSAPQAGDCSDTRTFPFPGIENAGDVRLAALKIRRFEILEEIGRGGHGVVFRANDRVLKRLVALKLPKPEVLRSKEMRRRFVSEAQTVAALDHPNIIKVYDAGFEATVCYIAQELCNGPSLATWLKAQPEEIRPDVAASIILALACGLDHAHRQNVLHRDLKPANVLLKPRDANSNEDDSEVVPDPASSAVFRVFPYTPKLGDFGICKAFDGDAEATGTRTGIVLGTASYMSPEQAVGVASELGPQSDVYSLGAILYEMLMGHPPFRGVTSAEVLKQVLVDEPALIHATRRDVPAALDAICLKCLKKAPAERYATAAELADDLRRFLAGETVHAPRPSVWQSFTKAAAGTPGRSTAIALLSLIVVLGLLGWYLRSPNSSPFGSPSASVGDGQEAISTDVRRAFNLWHENAERLRDNPNVGDEMTTLLAHHLPTGGRPDRRGFDWHYAWRLCHPAESVGMLTQIASFPAHRGNVYFVAFSRDGSRFATSGEDRTARIWDTQTRQPICVCQGHTGDVNWVDFSPDQQWLATASDDHKVKIWNASTGKEVFTLSGHETEVVAVRFSPIGDTLVSGDHAGVLKLWDFSTRRLIKSEPAAHHKKRIQSLAWGMSGHLLASIGDDNAFRLWEMPGMVLRAERETNESMCAAFSPVGNLIAYGGRGTIRIDDVHSGGSYATFSDHFDHIESINFSPDGRQLASCDAHGQLRLWDVATRQGWRAAPMRYDKTIKPQPAEPIGVGLWCVAFSPDGSQLVTTAKDGVVDVWDTSITPQWLMIAPSEAVEVPVPLAFSPDGRRLAVARHSAKAGRDRIQIWDVSLAHPKLVRDLHGLSAQSACYSSDGKQLVVGCVEKVEILDPRTGESHVTIPLAANSRATSVTYDGRGSLIVLENSNKRVAIHIVDPATGTKLRTFTDASFNQAGLHDHGFAVSADGKLAAVAPRTVTSTALCDLATGQVLAGRLGQRGCCGHVQFSPRGDLLAIASCGGVELWDPQTHKEEGFLSGLGREVGPLTFTADGRLLIVVSEEQRAVHVWDVRARKALFTLPLPADAAAHGSSWHLAVSPDARQIACSMWDLHKGGVYLYSASPTEAAGSEHPSLALEDPKSD